MLFKSNYNAHLFPLKCAVNTLPSQCVPGMAMTISEIMRKFASGVAPQISQPTFYDGLENFDAVDATLDPSFDLADATLLSSEIEARKAEREANAKKRNVVKADEPNAEPKAEGAKISDARSAVEL